MSSPPPFSRVLLIEDEPAHALLITRALKDRLPEVRHVLTIEEARGALEKERFGLIISDLKLPDAHGISHIREFALSSRGAPILVLTSSNLLSDAIEAMKLGAKDFVVKEFGPSFKDALIFAINRLQQVVEHEQERRRLEQEMSALRAAIEHGSDGLAVGAPDGLVEYANTAFGQISSLFGGDARSLSTLFVPHTIKSRGTIEELVRASQELPLGGVWQTVITHAVQKERVFSVHLSIVRTVEGRGNQWVLWMRDISELHQRERFQRELLSTTTHDLKGPLGAILISAELTSELVQTNEKASQLLMRISSSAQGAINLIEEFLSARRIQEGNFILKPLTSSLKDLAQQVIEEFSPIALSRGIALTLEGEETSSEVDPASMKRVIANLVSNGLKFTPQGGQVVVATHVVEGGARIEVRDTGSGLSPSEVGQLFEKFSRADRHRDIQGSGLGLYLVKSIVTAHGGRIGVTSTPGKGTTFSLELPKTPPVNERGEIIVLHFG